MAVDPVYRIVECVARRYGLSVERVLGPHSWREKRARLTAAALARDLADRSLEDLADWFGYADVSGVRHAVRRRDDLMAKPEMAGFDPGEIPFGDRSADIGEILAAIERLGRRIDVIEAAIGVRRGGSPDAE